MPVYELLISKYDSELRKVMIAALIKLFNTVKCLISLLMDEQN